MKMRADWWSHGHDKYIDIGTLFGVADGGGERVAFIGASRQRFAD
jgi:hypothetical protein